MWTGCTTSSPTKLHNLAVAIAAPDREPQRGVVGAGMAEAAENLVDRHRRHCASGNLAAALDASGDDEPVERSDDPAPTGPTLLPADDERSVLASFDGSFDDQCEGHELGAFGGQVYRFTDYRIQAPEDFLASAPYGVGVLLDEWTDSRFDGRFVEVLVLAGHPGNVNYEMAQARRRPDLRVGGMAGAARPGRGAARPRERHLPALTRTADGRRWPLIRAR